MFDIEKRKFFDQLTAGVLRQIIDGVDDNTAIFVCCDSPVWIHVEQDGSIINFDNDDLSEEYDNHDSNE